IGLVTWTYAITIRDALRRGRRGFRIKKRSLHVEEVIGDRLRGDVAFCLRRWWWRRRRGFPAIPGTCTGTFPGTRARTGA
ncbi:MAG: hypothetical protein ACT6SC_19375, partial [Blastomonas fulva]